MKYFRDSLQKRSIKNDLDLIILLCVQEERHGYGIIDDIHEGLGSPLGSGTVYSRLYRLRDAGLVGVKKEGKTNVYKITRSGRREISEILRERRSYEKKLRRFVHNRWKNE